MIKAKFKCDSVKKTVGQELVEMSAVVSGSEENKDFSKYTPQGSFTLTVTDQTSAFGYFEPGKEYFFNISVDSEELKK